MTLCLYVLGKKWRLPNDWIKERELNVFNPVSPRSRSSDYVMTQQVLPFTYMWLAERNWAKSRNVDTPTRHAWKWVIGFLSTAFSPVSAASASANRSLWIHRSYYWHQQTIRDVPVKLTPFSHQNLPKIWDNHNFLEKKTKS